MYLINYELMDLHVSIHTCIYICTSDPSTYIYSYMYLQVTLQQDRMLIVSCEDAGLAKSWIGLRREAKLGCVCMGCLHAG